MRAYASRSPLGRLQGPEFWIAVSIAALTLAVFAQVRHHQLLGLDDYFQITRNPHLAAGLSWEGLRWAFTEIYEANWIPLTSLSLLLNYELGGLDPAGYLLTNVALHLASALVLFAALRRMSAAPWPSGFVAAVFAIHPLHVESVAWASERKDVLSGLFWMLTLWAYARWVPRRPSRSRYLLVVACLALGLLAKATLVTLPFVLLLLDHWPLRRLSDETSKAMFDRKRVARAVVEKLPLLLLVVVASAVTYAVQRSGGAMRLMDSVPFEARVANALTSYGTYLVKAFWPTGLAAFYPHPRGEVSSPSAMGAALVLMALSAWVIRELWRRPYLAVGWFWYLGSLVPMLGIVQVGSQAMADRYTYIPLIGLAIAVAWGLWEQVEGRRVARLGLAVTAGIALLALGAGAWVQVRHWRDGVALFEHAIRVTGDNPLAQRGLGRALLREGRFEDAIPHFQEAIRLRPQWAEPRKHLADALLGSGRFDLARRAYARAVEFDPNDARYRVRFGKALARDGQVDRAIPQYRAALRIGANVDASSVLALLASARSERGDYHGAARDYRRAIELKPGVAEVHVNLGDVLFKAGKLAEAESSYRRALALASELPELHAGLARVLLRRGDAASAAAAFREALRLRPDWVPVANNLAWLLATCEDEAVRNPDEALRLAQRLSAPAQAPGPAILDTLAVSYAAVGRFEDAVRTSRRAADLARRGGSARLAETIEERILLYVRGRPYREGSAGSGNPSAVPD